MQDSVLNSPIFYTLALTLIHFVWQGCLVAGMLKLLLSITSYSKAHWRYIYASGAMLVCLILPLITFTIIDTPEHAQFGLINEGRLLLEESTIYSNSEQSGWYQHLVETLPFVSLAWFIVVALLTAKLIIELVNVNRLPYIKSQTPNAEMLSRFEYLVKQMGLKVKPILLLSLQTKVPMAIGWLKPVVLIPVSMVSGLTPSQLDMLILHELAHIRRHDYLVNLLQTLVEILLFFHPAIRWISKQMRNEREYCSDDLAVAVAGDPLAYARTLADTASLCTKNHRHNSIPSMAMAASGGDLKQRVVRLVDNGHHCSQQDDSGKWLASILIIFTLLAVAIKPFLVVPLFDLSAGRISLFSDTSTTQAAYNSDNKHSILPTNSIAKKLLAQNEQPDTSQTADVSEVKLELATNQKTLKNVNDLTTNKESDKAVIDEPQIASVNKIKSTAVTKQKVNNENQVASSINEDSLVNNTISIPLEVNAGNQPVLKEKQTSSIPVFESGNKVTNKSNFKNAYSKQLEELAREPIFLEQKFAVENSYLNEKEVGVQKGTVQLSGAGHKELDLTTKGSKPINNKVNAKLISSIEPKYPSNAKRKGLELDILVSFTIDKEGYVKTIKFERKNRVSYFRGAIKSAMEKWRFIPATENGERVESHMSKIFSFSLMK